MDDGEAGKGLRQIRIWERVMDRAMDWALSRRCVMLGGAIALGLVAGALAILYAVLIEPRRIVVERVRVPVRGLDASLDGFTLAQLSDLHCGAHPRWPEHIQRAVAIANDLRPDAVVITGDFVDDTRIAGQCAEILAALHAPHGVTAVLGNHDYYGGLRRPATIMQALQSAGITVLRNDVLTLQAPATLSIIGVDDGYTGHDKLVAALDRLPAARATRIMLSHYPDVVERLAPRVCDLVLSGHAHGGQLRLPLLSYLATRYHVRTLYARGLYSVEGTPLYVSRGLGTMFPQARFLCTPEVTLITLVAAGS